MQQQKRTFQPTPLPIKVKPNLIKQTKENEENKNEPQQQQKLQLPTAEPSSRFLKQADIGVHEIEDLTSRVCHPDFVLPDKTVLTFLVIFCDHALQKIQAAVKYIGNPQKIRDVNLCHSFLLPLVGKSEYRNIKLKIMHNKLQGIYFKALNFGQKWDVVVANELEEEEEKEQQKRNKGTDKKESSTSLLNAVWEGLAGDEDEEEDDENNKKKKKKKRSKTRVMAKALGEDEVHLVLAYVVTRENFLVKSIMDFINRESAESRAEMEALEEDEGDLASKDKYDIDAPIWQELTNARQNFMVSKTLGLFGPSVCKLSVG